MQRISTRTKQFIGVKKTPDDKVSPDRAWGRKPTNHAKSRIRQYITGNFDQFPAGTSEALAQLHQIPQHTTTAEFQKALASIHDPIAHEYQRAHQDAKGTVKKCGHLKRSHPTGAPRHDTIELAKDVQDLANAWHACTSYWDRRSAERRFAPTGIDSSGVRQYVEPKHPVLVASPFDADLQADRDPAAEPPPPQRHAIDQFSRDSETDADLDADREIATDPIPSKRYGFEEPSEGAEPDTDSEADNAFEDLVVSRSLNWNLSPTSPKHDWTGSRPIGAHTTPFSMR